MEKIYENIKAIRKAKNISQADMADKLGMYPANYNRLENGLTQLTIERLEQLAKLFEMTAIEIMQYGDEKIESKLDTDTKIDDLQKEIIELQGFIKQLGSDLNNSYTYMHETITFLSYLKQTMYERYKEVENEDENLITLFELNKIWSKKVSFRLFPEDEYQKHIEESPLRLGKLSDIYLACDSLHDALFRYSKSLKELYENIKIPSVYIDIDSEKKMTFNDL